MLKVVCGVIYKEDEIFIARKKQGKALAGFWEFPGGKIEEGENPEDALARELEEELGMTVIVHEFIGCNTYNYPTNTIKLHAFKCVYVSATMKLIDHDQYIWCDSSDLINFKLAPADKTFLKFISKKAEG